MNAWKPIALTVLCTVLVGSLLLRFLIGFHTEEPTIGRPATTLFTYDAYNALMDAYATPEGVDYTRLRQDLALEELYGQFASSGPTTTPSAFQTDADKLAYWINAYNVAIRVGISRHWPVESPLDIHGVIEPLPGFGFFRARSYIFDGQKISLHGIEKHMRTIPGYRPDVRVLMACGTEGCPRWTGPAVDGESLSVRINTTAVAFMHDEANIRIDDTARTIGVSSYLMAANKQFAEASVFGSMEGWLKHFARDNERLRDALDAKYAIEPLPFSWKVEQYPPVRTQQSR